MFNPNPATVAAAADCCLSPIVPALALPLPKATRAPSRREHLSLADIREAVNAATFAKHLNKPLNRHITVWWKHSAGFSPEPRAWIAHQGRYLKSLLAWLAHRGTASHYIATREYGDAKGAHSHILIHVPTDLAAAFDDFIVAAGNFDGCPDGIHNRPVVMTGGFPWEKTGAETPAQRAAILRYVLKDISPRARVGGVLIAEALVFKPEANTKLIEGKRVSVHRSIGHAARQEADWHELSTLSELRAALPTGEDAKRERRQQAKAQREAGHV
jgi:hypothetical protein